MYIGKKSAEAARFSDRPIVFGSSDFRPICKSAKKSAETKFGSDQNSAKNHYTPCTLSLYTIRQNKIMHHDLIMRLTILHILFYISSLGIYTYHFYQLSNPKIP